MKRWLASAMVVASIVAAAQADERRGGELEGLMTRFFVCAGSQDSTLPGFEGNPGSPFAPAENAYAIVSEDEIVFIVADELILSGSCKRGDPLARRRN